MGVSHHMLFLPLLPPQGEEAFPLSSAGSLPWETILHKLLQDESLPQASVLHELLKCGFLPQGIVLHKQMDPASMGPPWSH